MSEYALIQALPSADDIEAWREVYDVIEEQVGKGGKKLELVTGAAIEARALLAERDKLLELLQCWYAAQYDTTTAKQQAEENIRTFFGEAA